MRGKFALAGTAVGTLVPLAHRRADLDVRGFSLLRVTERSQFLVPGAGCESESLRAKTTDGDASILSLAKEVHVLG
jgi:hypothetical protein